MGPSTGVHKQNVGNQIKAKLKGMWHKEMLASYVDELMWCECHGTTSCQDVCGYMCVL